MHPLFKTFLTLPALAGLLAVGAPVVRAEDDNGAGASIAQNSPAVYGPVTFERTTGAPDTYSDHFPVPAAASYVLWLKNGDFNDGGDPEHRVASASVVVNGAMVVSPSDLNETVDRVVKTISLPAGENSISVQLNGQPGGYLTIAISRTPYDLTLGRLVLPWVTTQGSTANIALKNGSHRHKRGIRAVFYNEDGSIAGKSARIILNAHGSTYVSLAALAGGLNFSSGSIEFMWAGPGPARVFGFARVKDSASGLETVVDLNHAGSHRRRKALPTS